MYGWIHESFRQLVNRKYGREVWLQILDIAKMEEGTESIINKCYRDEETFRLIAAFSSVIGIPMDDAWEAYGGFLIQFTMETGWDELLRVISPDLEGFLKGLDALHYFIDHVVYRTKVKGPGFRCEARSDGSLILHYYSTRSGLYPIVKGVLREVSRRIFEIDVGIKVQERRQENVDTLVTEHVTFVITQVENPSTSLRSITSKSASSASEGMQLSVGPFPVSAMDFCTAFPHHFCFSEELVIQHVGAQMKRAFPWICRGETKLSDVLHLVHPEIAFTFESLMAFRTSLFVFQLKDMTDPAIAASQKSIVLSQVPITLKGSMVNVCDGAYMIFMCSPNVATVRELVDRNLTISDIPRHDSTRDLVMLNQSRLSQVELNRKLEETTRNLKKMAVELETEKQKTEDLICELMPSSVAEALRQGHTMEACEFQEATVLFTDIVTFTNICAKCTPYDVVNLLNDLYLRFDRLVGLHDVYKVETIGDAYMIVGGVPQVCENHAEKVLNVSIGMLMESKSVLSPITQLPIRMRVGVHSGAVVAGVVGLRMPRYCLFGDTCSIAQRMESYGIACKVHTSDSTKKLALKTNPAFVFTDRGYIDLKVGKGVVYTHFLERNERKSVWEICGRTREPEQTIDGYAELNSDTVADPAVDKDKKHKSTKENGASTFISTGTPQKSKACLIL